MTALCLHLQDKRKPDSTLSDFDQKWVALSSDASKAAADVMAKTLANTSVWDFEAREASGSSHHRDIPCVPTLVA